MFGGHDNALDYFLRRGYWYCWEPTNEDVSDRVLGMQKLFKDIKKDDCIAVKKLRIRKGEPGQIEILALGIVKEVDMDEWRVYVDWKVEFKSEERLVPSGGAAASLHGPYEGGDPWIQQIFCL